MKLEEAAQIINTYMLPDNAGTENYTKSLDTLIPAWEKMNIDKGNFSVYKSLDGREVINYFFRIGKGNVTAKYCTKTIQGAAAIATAKAIRELK